MSEPMRFSLKHHGQLSCVEHCPEGEYVLHSDYARLKAEVERLKLTPKVFGWTDKTYIDKVEFDKLQAEVERLTKAGDEMWKVIWLAECIAGVEHTEKSSQFWNDAKEGKQS